MILYHGTSLQFAHAIAERGLLPRTISGVDTLDRYQHDMKWLESVEGFVYLATIAAPYHACQSAHNERCDMALVAVDLDALDPTRLFPDEDYACGTYLRSTYPNDWGLRLASDRNGVLTEAHGSVRSNMSQYQHQWRGSLDEIGKVAHQGPIAPATIKKITTVSLSDDLMAVLIRLCQMSMTDEYDTEAQKMAVYRRVMPVVTRWMAGAWDCTADSMQTPTERFAPEVRRKINRLFGVRAKVVTVQSAPTPTSGP